MPNYELSLTIIDKIEKKNYKDYNILCKESLCTNDEELKCYLLKHNKIDNNCHKCKIKPVWNNKPLDFIIERKNNKKNDNRLENICFLCPNCFYQKNKKSVYDDIKNSKMGICIDCNTRFKRKKITTSLNPRNDIFEKQIKHQFIRLRCNFCSQKNMTNNENVILTSNKINNDIIITI